MLDDELVLMLDEQLDLTMELSMVIVLVWKMVQTKTVKLLD